MVLLRSSSADAGRRWHLDTLAQARVAAAYDPFIDTILHPTAGDTGGGSSTALAGFEVS
jgi:hypothetical protein